MANSAACDVILMLSPVCEYNKFRQLVLQRKIVVYRNCQLVIAKCDASP